nr:hypothetical protein Iba_chr05bCG7240 [Ipomoea batatas]
MSVRKEWCVGCETHETGVLSLEFLSRKDLTPTHLEEHESRQRLTNAEWDTGFPSKHLASTLTDEIEEILSRGQIIHLNNLRSRIILLVDFKRCIGTFSKGSMDIPDQGSWMQVPDATLKALKNLISSYNGPVLLKILHMIIVDELEIPLMTGKRDSAKIPGTDLPSIANLDLERCANKESLEDLVPITYS